MFGEHSLDDPLGDRVPFAGRSTKVLPESAVRIDELWDVLTFADRAVPATVGVVVVAEPLVLTAIL